jgi:aromatic ring-opening dioxygenase catalytic subunit (LigB family)
LAEIVAAFAACHAPPLIQRPDAVPEELRGRVFGLYREVGRRLMAAGPQALVVITNEHLHNFSLGNFPAVCIGMAESYAGPSELWLKLPAHMRQGSAALGEYLYRSALEADFDPSFSHALTLDHGTLTPLHLAGVPMDLPLVPILFNNVEPPLPTMRRCLRWGAFLGEALRAYTGLERVAVLGTGGLSHDIGTPNMGAVDEDYDREFLRLLAARDAAPLVRFAQERTAAAGNGAEEVRNWIVTRGVVGDAPLDVLFYEPTPDWYIGLGIVEWKVRSPAASAVVI